MSVKEVLGYLILKALVGDVTVLNIIDDYFNLGMSPSEIARAYGISKYTVRGFIERVLVKGRYRYRSIEEAVRAYLPVVLDSVKPIIKFEGGLAKCAICGKRLDSVAAANSHIVRAHGDLLNKLIKEVMARAGCKARERGIQEAPAT